jgi:3-hydroxyacyl-CoA dehydrogenase
MEKAVSDADLVIEAIVENLNTKQQLLQKLEQICPKFAFSIISISFFVGRPFLPQILQLC